MVTNDFRLFIDMDGVLARFNNTISSLDVLYEENYYKNLLPLPNVVKAVEDLIDKYPDKIFIASAILNSPYAKAEKLEWLHEYIPGMKEENIIFTEYGQNKADFIPGGVSSHDYLLDDFTSNLNQWNELGGSGIKLINNINNTNKTWLGPTIQYNDGFNIITEQLDAIVSKNVITLYHGSPSLFKNFDFDHIGDNYTEFGKGFYFAKEVNEAMQYVKDDGFFYKVNVPVIKELSLTELNMTSKELHTLINALPHEEKEILLSNYGDYDTDGIQKVQNEAVQALLKYSECDVGLIGDIINYGIPVKKVNSILHDKLGYDHIHINHNDGTELYVSLTNDVTINSVFQYKNGILNPVDKKLSPSVTLDVNYVDYDISSIQKEMKTLNQLFVQSLQSPNTMPDIRVNLQIDNQDLLKNEHITINDLKDHIDSIQKGRSSSLVEILKSKAQENAMDNTVSKKLEDLFDKIVIEELQIIEITQTIGA